MSTYRQEIHIAVDEPLGHLVESMKNEVDGTVSPDLLLRPLPPDISATRQYPRRLSDHSIALSCMRSCRVRTRTSQPGSAQRMRMSITRHRLNFVFLAPRDTLRSHARVALIAFGHSLFRVCGAGQLARSPEEMGKSDQRRLRRGGLQHFGMDRSSR